MQAPYLIMTGLYLLLTGVVTLDSSLASIGLMPALAGLKWMRVHFVTLGVLTQMVFGLLPWFTARGLKLPNAKMNWATWLFYNSGLVILLIGLPSVNAPSIITGGTLIFIAILFLMKDLIALRRTAIANKGRTVCETYSTTRFYLGSLLYLLVGVIVGTGLWIGWSEALHIAVPKEVHVHTNLWGFTAIVFAGILYDLFPELTRQKLLGKLRLDMLVFGSMMLGTLGLVTGPWLDIGWPAVVGLVLHTIGTLIQLAQLIRLVVSQRKMRNPGMAHLVSSYLWLLMPVIVAPYIVAKATEDFPVAEVTGNGGPILIYGWIVTFSLAVLPYFFNQTFQPKQNPSLGGSWLSLLSMHIGSVIFWAALFFPAVQAGLRAGAYFLWFAGLLPLLVNLYLQTKAGVDKIDQNTRLVVPTEKGYAQHVGDLGASEIPEGFSPTIDP